MGSRRAIGRTALSAVGIVAVAVVAALALAAVLGPRSTHDGSGDYPAWSLSGGSCTRSGGVVTYSGTITNDDDAGHTYYLTATFDSDGVREDTDQDVVRDVEAGQTARWRFLGRAGSGTTECRISHVDER